MKTPFKTSLFWEAPAAVLGLHSGQLTFQGRSRTTHSPQSERSRALPRTKHSGRDKAPPGLETSHCGLPGGKGLPRASAARDSREPVSSALASQGDLQDAPGSRSPHKAQGGLAGLRVPSQPTWPLPQRVPSPGGGSHLDPASAAPCGGPRAAVLVTSQGLSLLHGCSESGENSVSPNLYCRLLWFYKSR